MKLRLLGGWCLILGSVALGQQPAWWSERGVLIPGKPALDYRVANQGQMKHMALRAYEEFEAKWPDPANTNILAMITAFPADGNYRPVNLGMLKHAAQPFYDRLVAIGYATNYPWTGGAPADYALANQGQLKNLFSFDFDAHDADVDGLPDWWERLYFGSITGAVASADDDGDGLINLEELQHGTDPTRADTSGDGISDGWAVQHGFNPLDTIAHIDSNGDGLTNGENYLHGIDPWAEDTNGDGISDYVTLRQVGISPLSEGFDGTRTVLQTLMGAAADFDQSPGWIPINDYAFGALYGGRLAFTLEVEEYGHYGLAFQLRNAYSYTRNPRHHFRLYISGEEVARQTVLVSSAGPSELLWIPAPFESGTHEVVLRWDFKPHNGELLVHQLELVELGGPDTTGDGFPDWISQRIGTQPWMRDPAPTSWVSPLCLEGARLAYGTVEVTSTPGGGSSIEPHWAPQNRWYANIPLSPTQDTGIDVRWANDIVWTNVVSWKEFNLLGDAPEAITIRTGDALLLNARPPQSTEGTFTITVGDGATYGGAVAEPVIHQFNTAGVFTVSGTWEHDDLVAGGTSVVEVVAGNFAEVPAVWIRRPRAWENPDLPPGLVLEADYDVTVQQEATGGGTELTLDQYTEGVRHILARIGQDGPIVATSRIEGFTNYSSWQVYVKLLETLPDGTLFVESGIVAQHPVEGLRVHLSMHAAGAVFEDGSKLLDLMEEDFDELGFCSIRFYQAPGVNICHQLKIFQNDQLVGWR